MFATGMNQPPHSQPADFTVCFTNFTGPSQRETLPGCLELVTRAEPLRATRQQPGRCSSLGAR